MPVAGGSVIQRNTLLRYETVSEPGLDFVRCLCPSSGAEAHIGYLPMKRLCLDETTEVEGLALLIHRSESGH
jgi:hypothetical protein